MSPWMLTGAPSGEPRRSVPPSRVSDFRHPHPGYPPQASQAAQDGGELISSVGCGLARMAAGDSLMGFSRRAGISKTSTAPSVARSTT
jgi:hypothetical protein